jgi:hypothetical protein
MRGSCNGYGAGLKVGYEEQMMAALSLLAMPQDSNRSWCGRSRQDGAPGVRSLKLSS